MKHIEQYIAKLDEEIHEHIKAELESDLLFENEQALHILFENRKHAIEMCKAHERAAATPVLGEAVGAAKATVQL